MTNEVIVRKANKNDEEELAKMRGELFSGSDDDHQVEIENYFQNKNKHIRQIFVIENCDQLIGLIELNIRDYAEGSKAAEVPYIEGWYVAPEYRGQGLGRKLIAAAESWSLENSFFELASDVCLENSNSIKAHEAIGFSETDRIICFLKKLS